MKKAALLVVLAGASTALATPVGIDGVIGADWSGPGVTTAHVAADPGDVSFTSNTTNHPYAYDTYFRTDGAYAYFAVAVTGAYGGGWTWANLYFANTAAAPTGSNIGMEVTNNRFFTPVNTPNPSLSNNPTPDGFYYAAYVPGGLASQYQWSWQANAATGVIELAIPFAFFTDDPLGMGFGPSSHVWFRSSQSFGYNFVYGSNVNDPAVRFGIAEIPAPGAAGLLGVAAAAGLRRRRR